MAERQQKLRLAHRAEAAATAREAVDELAGLVDDAALYDMRLLVTEVVGSRVRQPAWSPGAWLELDIDVDQRRVRVEVTDMGQHWVFERVPFSFEPEASSGWSLYLVDRLADRWGIERTESTVGLWFEVDCD
jgi:hypothetical protein